MWSFNEKPSANHIEAGETKTDRCQFASCWFSESIFYSRFDERCSAQMKTLLRKAIERNNHNHLSGKFASKFKISLCALNFDNRSQQINMLHINRLFRYVQEALVIPQPFPLSSGHLAAVTWRGGGWTFAARYHLTENIAYLSRRWLASLSLPLPASRGRSTRPRAVRKGKRRKSDRLASPQLFLSLSLARGRCPKRRRKLRATSHPADRQLCSAPWANVSCKFGRLRAAATPLGGPGRSGHASNNSARSAVIAPNNRQTRGDPWPPHQLAIARVAGEGFSRWWRHADSDNSRGREREINKNFDHGDECAHEEDQLRLKAALVLQRSSLGAFRQTKELRRQSIG